MTRICSTCKKVMGWKCGVEVCQSKSDMKKNPIKRIHSSGYIVFSLRGKDIYEHRYVMERHLGRPLRTNEHVHHKDGNKTNNRLSNLIIAAPQQHGRLHRKTHCAQGHRLTGSNVYIRPDESTRQCAICRRRRFKKFRRRNPSYFRDWARNNRSKVNEYKRKYRAAQKANDENL